MNPDLMGSFSLRPKETEIFSNYKPEGSIIPMITPATGVSGNHVEVDPTSSAKLIEYLIDGTGNHAGGIFILGTQGEFRSLSFNQKKGFIKIVTETVQGRLPTLVGISAPMVKEIQLLARIAQASGATALVVAPLYGKGNVSEKMEAASSVDLPIILYNNPPIHSGDSKGQDLSIEMIDSIREKFPLVVGLKDSTKNPRHLEEAFQLKGINLLHGSTRNAKDNWGGATGGVFAFANVYPNEAATLIDQVRKNPYDQEARNAINNLRQGLGVPSEIKTALMNRGIIASNSTFGNPT